MNYYRQSHRLHLHPPHHWPHQLRRWLVLLGAIVFSVLLPIGSIQADYVGTGSVQLSLDPASAAVVLDGYQVGDEVSYIYQQAPKELKSGDIYGAVAYGTVYAPPGVSVIGAEFVSFVGGVYSKIDAEDTVVLPDGCGHRGCYTYGAEMANGKINEVQQDTGIFYSTDAQTALLATPLSIQTTGSDVQPQPVHNQWDYNQILAFGAKTGALSGNGGKGDTPLVTTSDGATTYYGTGSGVAGPDTYYTNDYDPGCNASTTFKDDIRCTGPWNRIAYPNAKLGGTGPVLPTSANPGAFLSTAQPTTAGHNLSSSNPLPSGVNAVRYVFGARTVGDIELARITFKITDPAAFQASFTNNTFCADGTGGDHDKGSDGAGGHTSGARGAQDNIWRYYEGNNHTCYTGAAGAALTKTPQTVDGNAATTKVPLNSVIGYSMTFYNTTGSTLYDIELSDAPVTANLTLVPASTANCPYSDYNGDQAGSPTFNTISGGTATWNALSSLASGSSVTVHVCAQVASSGADGSEVRNQVSVLYALTSGGSKQPPLVAGALQVIGTPPALYSLGDRVWYDLDGQGDQDGSEVGINGVTVNLYAGACGPTGSPIQTKTTSGNGNYLFTGLSGGSYCVAVDTATLPAAGYSQTNSGAVSNPKTVSISGGSNLDIDFGYVANQCLPTIDFETDAASNVLSAGQIIDNEWAAWGITVATNSPSSHPLMIFDSASPSGGDTDLGTPNGDFGGPGVGNGGKSGMPGENSQALGKVLIISQDGNTGNPNDYANGGIITFTFDHAVRVDQLEILDIDNDEAGGTIKAYDATTSGNLITTAAMLGLGNNSYQVAPVNATGVRRLEIHMVSSGAVPSVTFCGTPPALYSLGDRVWNDTSEDGVQDSGELGIANVQMELLTGSTVVETKTTDAAGIYTFTNLPAGNYTVRVAATNFNSGGPLAGYVYSPKDQGSDDTKDSDFDPNTGSVAVNLTGDNPTIDGGFYEPVNLCYAVADGTTSHNDGNQKDTLAFLNRLTGATAALGSGVGNTNRYNIEAIAFQPGGTVLFAADAGRLGTLNLTTGVFTAVGSGFGSGDGSEGNNIPFNDVDGLTFDPTTGIFYGTVRRSGLDLLFQINPTTGLRVANAFGSNVDYVAVPAVAGLKDVDDIAVDPVTGVLYAIVNNGSSTESRLVTLDKSTGAATSVGTVKIGGSNIQDIEGLAFFNDGKLYGSSGKSGPTINALYQIDKTSAAATLIGAFTDPLRDFEGLDCLVASAAIVVEKSTNGQDADTLPGPTIAAGSTVTWTYFVRNTGGVTLNNVTVTDDKEGAICTIGALTSGQSQTCTQTGIAGSGQYTNTATAVGVRADNGQNVQDTDPSHYNGVGASPDYVITKVNNTDPNLIGVRKGETISFTVRITNTGDVPITTLPLRDTYVDGVLTYSGATPPPDTPNAGQLDWNDLTGAPASGFGVDLGVGQSFTVVVEFVGTADTTGLPGGVTINTATVRNAFYDPDGPGGAPPQPLPDKSATAPAKITAPTAVDVVNTALVYGEGSVQVRWQTINEANIAGFYLYRGVDGGALQRITDQMMAAQAAGQANGAVYHFTDSQVNAGHRYTYELEVAAFDGSSERKQLGALQSGPRIFLPAVQR